MSDSADAHLGLYAPLAVREFGDDQGAFRDGRHSSPICEARNGAARCSGSEPISSQFSSKA